VSDENSALTNLGNAAQALVFLIARKLNVDARAILLLGQNGRLHAWRLLDRSDLTVLEEVFLDEEYALDMPPPISVMDLGANFGAATIYFALRWPKAKIVAVEPNPQMFARLAANTAHYPNVSCLNYAVGAHDGTATFNISRNHESSSFYCWEPGCTQIEVQVRTLSSLMAEAALDHINLLKFDIEGAEELLFADKAILMHVDALVGEVHPNLMKMNVCNLMALLAPFDTRAQSISDGRFILKARKSPT
jgi:FkbM family methyltransferase